MLADLVGTVHYNWDELLSGVLTLCVAQSHPIFHLAVLALHKKMSKKSLCVLKQSIEFQLVIFPARFFKFQIHSFLDNFEWKLPLEKSPLLNFICQIMPISSCWFLFQHRNKSARRKKALCDLKATYYHSYTQNSLKIFKVHKGS